MSVYTYLHVLITGTKGIAITSSTKGFTNIVDATNCRAFPYLLALALLCFKLCVATSPS